MSLTIALATRGRPELLLDTIERTARNISRDDTIFAVLIDDDDQPTIDMLGDLGPDAYPVVRPREDSLGAKYNLVLDSYPAEVYLAMVDYAPHVTPGFDQKILDAAAMFADGIGVVYNRMANTSFPEVNAVTAGLAEKMGYIYPPYFPYHWIDHWLDDVTRMIGRIAVDPSIRVDLSRRPGTQGRRDAAFWAGWYNKTWWMREELAASIIGSSDFRLPEWYKQVLMSAFPLVRDRSEMINRGLVVQNPHHQVPDGPHYRRLREAAEEILRQRELLTSR